MWMQQSIVADHVHPFMATIYHLLYLQHEHDNEFSELPWLPQPPDPNQIEQLYDVI